ncbi:MAG TPA: transglycosylase family protein [Solirubrobacterales bacterium]|nr:transglycosylase family protein [Solirubrobacterales bacterium]
MNLSRGAVAPKLKIVLALMAVMALIGATAVAMTSSAVASSGGVSASSGGTGSGTGSGSGDSKYKRLWHKTSRHNKHWANKTAECESGKDPNAIGGGGQYRGAFQFMKSSWKNAPKTPGGDPIDYGYKTQAVVAVALKKHMGTKPWPVCG